MAKSAKQKPRTTGKQRRAISPGKKTTKKAPSAAKRRVTRKRTPPPKTKKSTRAQAKERSHKKLINATIRVLRREGPQGLTTGKIARAAGLSQPSFYVHFSDMDDALEAAAEEIGTRIRKTIREERRPFTGTRSRDTLRAAFAGAVNAFMAHPTFTELVLRYRRDDSSPIGAYSRDLVASIFRDLHADFQGGMLGDAPLRSVDIYAQLIAYMTFGVVEGLLDGTLDDREACIDTLVDAAIASYRQLSQQ